MMASCRRPVLQAAGKVHEDQVTIHVPRKLKLERRETDVQHDHYFPNPIFHSAFSLLARSTC